MKEWIDVALGLQVIPAHQQAGEQLSNVIQHINILWVHWFKNNLCSPSNNSIIHNYWQIRAQGKWKKCPWDSGLVNVKIIGQNVMIGFASSFVSSWLFNFLLVFGEFSRIWNRDKA